jgi:hypothetical protein
MSDRRPASKPEVTAARSRMAEVLSPLADVRDVVQRIRLDPSQHKDLRAQVTAILSRAHELRDVIDEAAEVTVPAA